jgi:hypothetical protein
MDSPAGTVTHDEFAFWAIGDDGQPWRRNAVYHIARNTELSAAHNDLFAHIGHGFSVFHIGPTQVPHGSEDDMATRMAEAIPQDCTQNTSACLLQVARPNLDVKTQRDTVPTLLLVVWGRAPDDNLTPNPAIVAENYMRVRQIGDDEKRMTYENFATHPVVKQKIITSSKYRSQIAARLLLATGIEPKSNIYTPDRSQLYSWLDMATCRVDVHEHFVSLVSDYNTKGQLCSCVAHGPSRGVTLYTQHKQTGTPKNTGSDRSPEIGAPASDILDLLLDPRTDIDLSELVEAIDTRMERYDKLPSTHSNVRAGGAAIDCIKFKHFAAYDENYTAINALLYASIFTRSTSICCSTVAYVMPAPARTSDGKLYGCIESNLSTISRHIEDTETHVIVPNNQEWREALISISPGKAAFVFMNQQTAHIDENSGEITRYRILRTDLADKAVDSHLSFINKK